MQNKLFSSSSVPRIVLICILLLAVIFVPVYAQECSSANECKKKIEEYEAKLGQLKEQKTNLSSELTRMDTQIYLTSL